MISSNDYNKKERKMFANAFYCMVHKNDIEEGYISQEDAERINKDLLTIVAIIVANKSNKKIIKEFIETWAAMATYVNNFEQYRNIVMEE